MPNQPAPLFTHDCDKCRFLGTVVDTNHGHGWVDLYVCDRGSPHVPSVVARFGDNGPEYLSSPVNYVEMTPTGVHHFLKAAKALTFPMPEST